MEHDPDNIFDDDDLPETPLPRSYGSDGYLTLEDEDAEDETASRSAETEFAAHVELAMERADAVAAKGDVRLSGALNHEDHTTIESPTPGNTSGDIEEDLPF